MTRLSCPAAEESLAEDIDKIGGGNMLGGLEAVWLS